jgi:predicted outer membrane repeat protein
MEPSDPTRKQARAKPPFVRASAGALGRCAGLAALFLVGTALSLVVTAPQASARVKTLYAYAHGGAISPVNCPQTSTTAAQCTLSEALSKAAFGSTVALATPGRSGHYVGNWAVNTTGTTSSAPLTIKPAPGVTKPTLDGNHGQPTGCRTKTCNGPVLTIGSKVHFDLVGVTIQNANNLSSGLGGAIENIRGGTLSVSHSTFLRNYASDDGGAIDNADIGGTGTLSVSHSTFSGNDALNCDGGAIANADIGGKGTVFVTASTFSGNSASNGNGGAIDSGDTRGQGSLMVLASTFLGNVAARAGAIDNADNASGTLGVSSSTFLDNIASLDDAGAIDNADWGGSGTASVSASTFSGNKTVGDGGAIDNADSMGTSKGTVLVSASTFSGNTAEAHGGAIDNSDAGGTGIVSVSASTFSGNKANNIYGVHGAPGSGAIGSGGHGTVWAAADIFDGPCHRTGGTWNDAGYNIGSNGTCLRGAIDDVDHGARRLGPLAYHGGPTETMLPLKGNPAIGVIPYETTVTLDHRSVRLCPAASQRGTLHGSRRHCNAGAVQSLT